ncbi:response regulator [Methylobacter psychrophilus]|uniref:response regulator n=1 Tax=Methylobacter psychrophilus TaxID=96941 RepID=UPI0021D4F9E8|nr:HD domain-containing phosphohydrolase [Methylobacter psychrophilus]
MSSHPIMIVDDETVNLAMFRQILEPQYDLVFARSGREALTIAAKLPLSLILLDIEMPDINGYQVCKALKSDPATESIPVIFATSQSETGNEEHGFAVGCVDYLCKPVVPSLVLARIRTHLSLVRTTELEQSQRDAIFMLGEAGHYNDNDTGVHIWRMAAYSKALATALGWTISNAELIELAAPMHDTGKIGIPDAVLQKPGKLDTGEWEIMRRHSQIGYDILSKSVAPVFKLAAEIALNHHEKWDGSGYPNGLAGTAIPESARIVALTDVFDALAMRRPYKEPWPLEAIFATIREGSGRHFDPRVVSCFFDIQAEILEITDAWVLRNGEI